jgi:hypothetical protein
MLMFLEVTLDVQDGGGGGNVTVRAIKDVLGGHGGGTGDTQDAAALLDRPPTGHRFGLGLGRRLTDSKLRPHGRTLATSPRGSAPRCHSRHC